MSYVSLHNHSMYSVLDGYQTVKEMVSRAKNLGQSALALTDHGTMRGIIDFYRECQKQSVKPILGCEFYFCPDITIRDRSFTHHLVLLAMNDQGYLNLKTLDSLAYQEESYFYKPRIDWEMLRQHSDGVICLSACMASIVNTENGEEWFVKYRDLFGDRFYAEIQPLNLDIQQAYNAKVIGLARKYNVPLVVTTDAHYAVPEDQQYHHLWTQINGTGYHDNENYLWSEQGIRDTAWIPEETKEECIAHTAEIAERCNVTIEFGGMHYPVFTDKEPSEVVRDICRKNWKAKVPKGKYKEYAERFEKEMKDLEATNFLNYFLIIWDLTRWCVEHNIPIGEGRGSVAGCLVGYLMGFHKIDAIKHGTEFFRFCNPFRVSAPDIDSDISTKNRGRVIDYIREHYGTVYKVSTYGYTKNPEKPEVGKQAVLRAVQALGKREYLAMDDQQKAEEERRKKTKEPSLQRWTRKRAEVVTKQLQESLDEILTVDGEFTEEERGELLDVAKHFCGRIDKIGVHASAILVTPDSVENYCPVEGLYSNDTSTGKREYTRVAAFEYHTLEDMGLLKLDILGLNTLDIIDNALNLIDEDIDMENIPLDDKDTYEMYREGNTVGVFQMESSGMQRVAKELQPNRFEDLAALVALFRPGPIDSGMLQDYIDGRHGKAVDYPCEAMKEITASSYGVIIYQEQCMKLAMKMAGYNLGEADGLRKVIGRKEMTKIAAAVKEFVERCVANGYTKEVAENVAKQIEAAGRYIFNKSHAVSYARLSYKTAYLKTHYPLQYMCALLNSRSDHEKILPYIEESKRLGIKLLPPDYSKGNTEWTIEGNAIRIGLCFIKGVGGNLKLGADSWESVVATNNKGVTEALIKAGALDFLGKSRGWMIGNLVGSQDALKRKQHCMERIGYYSEQRDNAIDAKAAAKAQRMIDQWKAKLDDVEFKESAAKEYDAAAGEMSVLSFSFKELPRLLTGKATRVFEKKDKNGNLMAFLTFSTDYGDIEGIVFASSWKKDKYHDRYRGWCKGITVEQGQIYEFVKDKRNVIIDARRV